MAIYGEYGYPDESAAVGLWRATLTFLAAPLLWSAHLGVSYLVVTVGCETGWGGTTPAVVLLTLLFLAAELATGWYSFRTWRRTEEPQRWDEALSEPPGRAGFILLMGMLFVPLFGFLTVLAGASVLLAPLCA